MPFVFRGRIYEVSFSVDIAGVGRFVVFGKRHYGKWIASERSRVWPDLGNSDRARSGWVRGVSDQAGPWAAFIAFEEN